MITCGRQFKSSRRKIRERIRGGKLYVARIMAEGGGAAGDISTKTRSASNLTINIALYLPNWAVRAVFLWYICK